MVGIYVITSPSGRIYVGQSCSIEQRFKQYKKKSCKDQPIIYNSLEKYGWKTHTFEVILELPENISQGCLDTWEEYFMDLYRSQGYELMNIKGAGSHGRHSEETKRKISDSHKKNGRDKNGSNNPMFGKKHSEISIQRIKSAKANSRKLRPPKVKQKNKSKYLVTVYKDGQMVGVFNKMIDAARNLSISYSSVKGVFFGKQKTAAGYTITRELNK